VRAKGRRFQEITCITQRLCYQDGGPVVGRRGADQDREAARAGQAQQLRGPRKLAERGLRRQKGCGTRHEKGDTHRY